MEKKEEKNKIINQLDSEIEKIKKIEKKEENKKYYQRGIFYGLVLGILGNLLVTLIWNLSIKNWKPNDQGSLAFVVMCIVIFAIAYFSINEHKEKIIQIQKAKEIIKDAKE